MVDTAIATEHQAISSSVNSIPSGRATRFVIAAVRIAVALLWIQNVNWKHPPDFGLASGGGFYQYVHDAISHPVFPPFTWAVEQFIVPNFIAFGYFTVAIESLLGAFLLAGFLTRFWSIIGILQITGITLSALNAPEEWQWSYYLMFAAQIVVLATTAGRVAGIDGLLRPRWSVSKSRLSRLLMAAS